MSTVTTLQKKICIKFEVSASPDLWTTVEISKIKHIVDDDGDDSVSEANPKVWRSTDFASLQAKVPNKIWNFLIANPYIPPELPPDLHA